jgi:hypothetical protein
MTPRPGSTVAFAYTVSSGKRIARRGLYIEDRSRAQSRFFTDATTHVASIPRTFSSGPTTTTCVTVLPKAELVGKRALANSTRCESWTRTRCEPSAPAMPPERPAKRWPPSSMSRRRRSAKSSRGGSGRTSLDHVHDLRGTSLEIEQPHARQLRRRQGRQAPGADQVAEGEELRARCAAADTADVPAAARGPGEGDAEDLLREPASRLGRVGHPRRAAGPVREGQEARRARARAEGRFRNDRQVREKHVYHAIDRANPRAEIDVEALAEQPELELLVEEPAKPEKPKKVHVPEGMPF